MELGVPGREDIGVSGCRLSDGRLHFGHYLGCLHPKKLSLVSKNFFVIQDQDTNLLGGVAPPRSTLRLLLSQLYSFQTACQIIPCLQSKIFPAYAELYDFARRAITVRTLETVHPKKDELKTGRVSAAQEPANELEELKPSVALPLRNYMFPVDQAVQFLAFAPKFILMNDDNLRFVHLARLLHKRLAPGVRDKLPSPELVSEPCPRLLASDGQKMSKANTNCIFFTDEARAIEEQIKNYARRLGWRWTKESVWKFEGGNATEGLTAGSPLLSAALTFDVMPRSDRTTFDASRIVDSIAEVALPLVGDIRSRSQNLLRSEGALLSRFEEDNQRAVKHIRLTIEALSS